MVELPGDQCDGETPENYWQKEPKTERLHIILDTIKLPSGPTLLHQLLVTLVLYRRRVFTKA